MRHVSVTRAIPATPDAVFVRYADIPSWTRRDASMQRA